LGLALHFGIMMGFSLCFSFPLGMLWFGLHQRVDGVEFLQKVPRDSQ
jgi:hypothetical protein